MGRPGSNGRTALVLGGVVVVMVGASFAAVPFYSWFCRVTGYGGTTSVAEAAGPTAGIVERTVTVSFDANTAPDMPWEFRPKQRSMDAAPRRDRARLLRGLQPDVAADRRAGRLQRRAVLGRRLLRQDRLLLLRAAGAAAGRAGRDAGHLLRRPGDARRRGDARRDRDHALLYDVPGRPARGRPLRSGRHRASRRRRPIAARRSNSRGTRAWPATRTTTTTSCRRASGR